MPSTDTLIRPPQESSILLALALPISIVDLISIASISIEFRLDSVSYVNGYLIEY